MAKHELSKESPIIDVETWILSALVLLPFYWVFLDVICFIRGAGLVLKQVKIYID